MDSLPTGDKIALSYTENGDKIQKDIWNENLIKLGQDKFLAHPFGILTFEEAKQRLPEIGDYKIYEIELYEPQID